MRFKTQEEVLARLEVETRRAVRRLEDESNDLLLGAWKTTQDELRHDILGAYHAQHGDTTWDYINSATTRRAIGNMIRTRLDWFLSTVSGYFKHSISMVKDLETERALWMLDQVTPLSVTPVRPSRRMEADRPKKHETTWQQRLSEYVDGYMSNLVKNINLGALNGSSPSDAADEVNATRVGTPSYDMAYVLGRMFITEAINAEADARDDVSNANGDTVQEEIWQTMMDATICPICSDNQGLTRDEADDDIPAHPNCRCFWRIVPKEYADLLSSGSPEDRALAKRMDDEGLPNSAMAVFDSNGKLAGKITVTFDDWKAGMSNIASGVQ